MTNRYSTPFNTLISVAPPFQAADRMRWHVEAFGHAIKG